MVALPGILRFLSTPSARRATAGHLHGPVPDWISIHALREEGDFSSHMDANRALNFYPRPPRGGRRGRSSNAQCPSKISIHALREEGDTIQSVDKTSTQSFLSTPSARRATRQAFQVQKYYEISIHALREEGDLGRGSSKQSMANFYPRPPRGGRRPMFCSSWASTRFLSTPSARRATQVAHRRRGRAGISIHALREEGDLLVGVLLPLAGEFLSTPSARRATYEDRLDMTITCQFLSTPSARRATGLPCRVHRRGSISIHALREEGDAAHSAGSRRSTNFYPRPPRGGRQSASALEPPE